MQGPADGSQHAVPQRARDPQQHDRVLPRRDGHSAEPGAAPYNILRAQELLEAVMPFTEQEVAVSLQEVHSLLYQWTTGLWGELITLSDSLESTAGTGTMAVRAPGTTTPAMDDALPPTLCSGNSSDDTATIESHRRRRVHAQFHE